MATTGIPNGCPGCTAIALALPNCGTVAELESSEYLIIINTNHNYCTCNQIDIDVLLEGLQNQSLVECLKIHINKATFVSTYSHDEVEQMTLEKMEQELHM